MVSVEPRRRLVVNADDFGRSRAVNEAVIRAHREGILTTASLMATAPAAAEAVELARANPSLGVGLHLTLSDGHGCLTAAEIPLLCGHDGRFRRRAIRAGLAFFFRPDLKAELHREIAAQFTAFAATGLDCDHLNGHLHLHLHPSVLGDATNQARANGVRGFRLTRDPFGINARLSSGAWIYRASHAIVFNVLCTWAGPRVRRAGLHSPDRVFGLLQNGRVDESFVLALLARLPAGDSEVYAHPSLTDSQHEFDALVSPRVRDAVASRGIQLIRYRELSPA